MIEQWGYYIGLGGALITVGALLQKIFNDNETHITAYKELKAIFNTNYYQRLFRLVRINFRENLLGLTDAEINSEIDNLFIIVGFFQRAKLLDQCRRKRATYFQIALITIGISTMIYPWIQPIDSVLPYYFAVMLFQIFLTLAIIVDRIYKTKGRDMLIEDLQKRITLGPDEQNGDDTGVGYY